MNAGICLLCYASPSEIERKLDEYRDTDMQFPGTREEGLLQVRRDFRLSATQLTT